MVSNEFKTASYLGYFFIIITAVFQFRGPNILRGAFARGICQNNGGLGHVGRQLTLNGFTLTPHAHEYIVCADLRRIESEESFIEKEMDRRELLVEKAYVSGKFD